MNIIYNFNKKFKILNFFLENELTLYLNSKDDLKEYIIDYKKSYRKYYENIILNPLRKTYNKKSFLFGILNYKIKKYVLNLKIKDYLGKDFSFFIFDELLGQNTNKDYSIKEIINEKIIKQIKKIVNYYWDEINKKEDVIDKLIKNRILKGLMKNTIKKDEYEKRILAELKDFYYNNYIYIAFDIYLNKINIQENKYKSDFINEKNLRP